MANDEAISSTGRGAKVRTVQSTLGSSSRSTIYSKNKNVTTSNKSWFTEKKLELRIKSTSNYRITNDPELLWQEIA